METEARRVAKAQLVTHMLQGQPWHAAAAAAGLRVSRSTAYQLLKRVRTLESVLHFKDNAPSGG